MKALILRLFVLFCVGLVLPRAHAQEQAYFPDPDPAIRQRLADWQDLKFGLLMHWGPYSQWGVVESWSICPEDVGWATGARVQQNRAPDYFSYLQAYENLATTFNPQRFNPQRWAKAAADAGMKYLVFTTKHHDGFCMFDTRTTDYRITGSKTPFSTNPQADVTRAIFDAFRQQQLWVGAYFSKPDWHSDFYWWKRFPPVDRHANYPINRYSEQWQKFVDYTHMQVDELMSRYGRLDILWLDGGWVRPITDEQVKNYLLDVYEGSRYARNPQSQDINMPLLVKNARAKQPGLIVVDRAVPGIYQNYLTPEQHIPETGLPYPWETCMTMSGSWSYTPGDVYKPADELVEKLVDIVSKGGNLLLNIGPGPDGEWSDTAYQRLQAMGQWLRTNGEAIYGTTMYSRFGQGDRIRFTQSKDGSRVYIHVLDYAAGTLAIPDFATRPGMRLTLLGHPGTLRWQATNGGIQITLPEAGRKAGDFVWVIRVEG